MTRRFTAVTLGLTATVAFLIGLIVAGSFIPTPALSVGRTTPPAVRAGTGRATGSLVNFADVAERINPAVVNIDATSRNAAAEGRRRSPGRDLFEHPFDFRNPQDDRDAPRRGAGSGFIIDAQGFILTNNHVVDRAERISVKLSDGRNLRARIVGTDPDTDIALIKVESTDPLPVAPLGDSETLRVGEWVCAIGNPLAYEHTVTVGVVSFIGRKLFDSSLDHYIQTDAAINFGNSGGPLINSLGEVIGINAAISSRASNIGFAVPINQANHILPQLKADGHVSRGYIGVELKDVDPDLQQSLKLASSEGALVQDVTEGSPAERAGLRTYDLIVAVDETPVSSNDELIQAVSARPPGSVTRLRVVRDGQPQIVLVKLAERPGREVRGRASEPVEGEPSSSDETRPDVGPVDSIGVNVRPLDREYTDKAHLPQGANGVIVSHVDPLSNASEAGVERGWLIMEINRRPVASVDDFQRIVAAAHPGDVLTLYVYIPDLEQRALRTVRLDPQ